MSGRLVVTMDTAYSFERATPEPAHPAEPDGSFWTGAPKLLAAFATILGSLVALTTVLVQAGVIGSPEPARAVAPTASLDGALVDLNMLLAESARAKGDLGRLIADVQAGPHAVDRETALRRIDEIVVQRRRLHEELATFSAPAPLSRTLALLRDSITASLADDRLVRRWIVAHYDGDGTADALWQAQLEASRAASEAKRVFRTEYAERLLASGLSGFIPDY